MISKEDYKNLLNYFEVNIVPDELENFIEKLKVIYEELCYREEVTEKLQDIHQRLQALSEDKKEE